MQPNFRDKKKLLRSLFLTLCKKYVYISYDEGTELDSGGASVFVGGGGILVKGALTKRPRTRSRSDLRGGNMGVFF